jgi:hypothetical protein
MNYTELAGDVSAVGFIVMLVQVLKPFIPQPYAPVAALAIGLLLGAAQAYVTKDTTALWVGVTYALQAAGIYAGTKHIIETVKTEKDPESDI